MNNRWWSHRNQRMDATRTHSSAKRVNIYIDGVADSNVLCCSPPVGGVSTRATPILRLPAEVIQILSFQDIRTDVRSGYAQPVYFYNLVKFIVSPEGSKFE